jgi:DNA-dependent RNA polymerase auxiliary subunit epsilon
MMETKTWYRVSKYEKQISEIQVVRETKDCIYVKYTLKSDARRILKSSSYEFYFESLEKAQERLKLLQQVEQAKQKNDRITRQCQTMYVLIKSMSENGVGTSDIETMKQIVAEVEA